MKKTCLLPRKAHFARLLFVLLTTFVCMQQAHAQYIPPIPPVPLDTGHIDTINYSGGAVVLKITQLRNKYFNLVALDSTLSIDTVTVYTDSLLHSHVYSVYAYSIGDTAHLIPIDSLNDSVYVVVQYRSNSGQAYFKISLGANLGKYSFTCNYGNSCNILTHNNFGPHADYDGNLPFGRDRLNLGHAFASYYSVVTDWVSSWGTPQIFTGYSVGIRDSLSRTCDKVHHPFPTPHDTVATFGAFNNLEEGLQHCVSVNGGHTYILSFYLAAFHQGFDTSNHSLDSFNVRLFNQSSNPKIPVVKGSYEDPTPPLNGTQLIAGLSKITKTSPLCLSQYVFCFTAARNYDHIVFYNTESGDQWNAYMAFPELVLMDSVKTNVNYVRCDSVTITPTCSINNMAAYIKWYSKANGTGTLTTNTTTYQHKIRPAGVDTISYVIKDDAGHLCVMQNVILQNKALNLSFTGDTTACPGSVISNWKIKISGGKRPYFYTVNGGTRIHDNTDSILLPTQTVTYDSFNTVIVVTDTNGCTNTCTIHFKPKCTCGTWNIFTSKNASNIISANGGSSIISKKKLEIVGTLTIDASITFKDCEIIMERNGPFNALIDLTSGGSKTLIIDSTSIHGCQYMWQGINIASTVNTNTLIIRHGSWIQDAICAVHAMPGHYEYAIHIEGTAPYITHFNKNYTGLWMDNRDNANAYNLHVYGTNFEDVDGVSNGSPHVTLKPGGPGTQSSVGIKLTNATYLSLIKPDTIGDPTQYPNTFNNMLNYGIRDSTTYLNVFNNTFQSTPIAIWAYGGTYDATGSTNFNLTVGDHSITSSGNTFTNISTGGITATSNIQLKAEKNTFNNTTPGGSAIQMVLCAGNAGLLKQSNINYNSITNFATGISATNMVYHNFTVTQNKNITNSQNGIYIGSAGGETVSKVNISHNIVDKTALGIAASGYNKPVINCNTVDIYSSTFSSGQDVGIGIYNCSNDTAQTNTIAQSASATLTSPTGCLSTKYVAGSMGFQVGDAVGSIINKNKVSMMESDIYAYDNNNPSKLLANIFTNGLNGIQIADATGDIGPQGFRATPITGDSNVWNNFIGGCNYNTYNNSSVPANNDTFYVPATPPSLIPSIRRAFGPPSVHVIPFISNPSCTFLRLKSPCTGTGEPPYIPWNYNSVADSNNAAISTDTIKLLEHKRHAQLVKNALLDTTTLDYDANGSIDATDKAISKDAHFHEQLNACRLWLTDNTLQSDTSIASYIHKILYRDAGRIARLDAMINTASGNSDTAMTTVKSTLDSLDDNYTLTHNSRIIYRLYLKQTSPRFSGFTNTEINALHNIARQCPRIGGPAVYKAWIILAGIDSVPMNYYTNCPEHKTNSNKEIENKQDIILLSNMTNIFSIAPNPVRDILNISYNTTLDENIFVTDLTGRILSKYYISKGSGLLQVDMHTYVQGIYIIKGCSSTNICNFGKVIEVLR